MDFLNIHKIKYTKISRSVLFLHFTHLYIIECLKFFIKRGIYAQIKRKNAKDLQEVFSQRYRSIAPNPECRLFEEN
ncbi:hypothetical protein C4Q31_04460 [Leptospira borgpetersenii serovar Ceylonica]|nr:hypothetical protein C4Q31_04460 [Leptospira borgpetersenii serovar Ceylonica]